MASMSVHDSPIHLDLALELAAFEGRATDVSAILALAQPGDAYMWLACITSLTSLRKEATENTTGRVDAAIVLEHWIRAHVPSSADVKAALAPPWGLPMPAELANAAYALCCVTEMLQGKAGAPTPTPTLTV